MSSPLKHRVALVTGAARGIGAAIASHFARQGCFVAVGDVDRSGAAARAAELGPGALGVPLDVRNRESIREAVRQVLQQHGGIDILINNAGVLCSGPFDAASDEEWDLLLSVNVTGVFHCVRGVVPAMLGRKGAAIINIASISAEKGGGVFGNVWYGATKAAVIAMTKGLARELGPSGIRVNAISPGVIETEMVRTLLTSEVRDAVLRRVPLGRFVTAEDIAQCAAFLASNEASLITGETVVIDGGLTKS